MDKGKQGPTMHCLQETHFRFKGAYRLKVKEWKKISYNYSNQKRAGVVMSTSVKVTLSEKLSRDARKDII